MIVLTGAAGFIGSCFLWKLNQEGIKDIICVDHLATSEKWKNLVKKDFRDYIEKDDFLNLIEEDKISGITHIVHMGACSSTTFTDASYFIKNNYEYSKKLALYAAKNKIPFIYASSAATYGDGALGYDDKHETVKDLSPLNMYGYSKQLFDLWVLRNKYEQLFTGIKFFNVFGPNEYHKGEMMSVICKRFNDVRQEGIVRLFKSYKDGYADGQQKRDFIYIKDAVEVMYFFFKNRKKTGIYNLGTGKARSWNDLANAMFAALNKKPNIEYTEMPENLRQKYQYFTEAKMDKVRNAGCNHKFNSLEESIKDYTKYLSENSYL